MTKPYAADYSQKELAGKTVEWRATVKEIYRRELPTVDDDFAKDLGDENLEEFRTRVRAELLEHARQEADAARPPGTARSRDRAQPGRVAGVVGAREVSAMEAELHQTLEAGGVSHEDATERVKQSAEDLKTRAQKRARTSSILDALADQEKIEVDDEELADRMAQIVTQSGRKSRPRRRILSQGRKSRGSAATMRREKAMDFISEPRKDAKPGLNKRRQSMK